MKNISGRKFLNIVYPEELLRRAKPEYFLSD